MIFKESVCVRFVCTFFERGCLCLRSHVTLVAKYHIDIKNGLPLSVDVVMWG